MNPKGLEVVTVALDTGGADAAREFIELADPDHPALIDEAHILDELLGIVNVPSGVWIDEHGHIVRPPDIAWTRSIDNSHLEIPEDADADKAELIRIAKGLRIDGDPYVEAIRDWANNGSESEFALDPDEVIERSRPRPFAYAKAAAAYELGQHLHREGFGEDAIAYFREAHSLYPENWTYKRQAWSFVDPKQGQTDTYEGYWRKDVAESGVENYYPEFTP